jgi:hypothetical protein
VVGNGSELLNGVLSGVFVAGVHGASDAPAKDARRFLLPV